MEENTQLPELTEQEIRVLGSLMEKSRTTPEYYPMTLNGLQTACNQKSSRKPVVQYDESTIIDSLNTLKRKGLISTVVGGGSRVTKYKHNIAIQFPLVPQEVAILCLLFLRGPLTSGEINSNSGRLYEFESLEDIQKLLNKLSADTPQYVKQLAKKPGQKEARYIHMFSPFNEDNYESQPEIERTSASDRIQLLEGRIEELDQRLTVLQAAFDKLMNELT